MLRTRPERRRLRQALLIGLALLGSVVAPPSAPAAMLAKTRGGPSVADVAEACGAAWRAPVTATIIDGFRPPENPYGAGNRGLEYATTSGDPVIAVAAGVVRFAGSVGGNRFVVIQHGQDLKATYGYLTETLVVLGQHVLPGDRVATADVGFHLTARRTSPGTDPGRAEVYIDPLPLLTGRCFVVKLVPLPKGG